MPSPIGVFEILFAAYGPQHWWPAETKFEIVVGAMLTQNTSWRNVEKACGNLKKQKLLDVASIACARIRTLENAVYHSGFFRQKAERLKSFCVHVQKRHDCDIEKFLSQPQGILGEELMLMKGVGRETADSIMLYAAGYPVFVVDAYTRRIFGRLGICDEKNSGELQSIITKGLEKDIGLYKEFHALLVLHAKTFCKKKPSCRGCPLKKVCRYDISLCP